MTKVIQIRGVADDVHAKLVEAAENAGKSLTAYLADELASIAGRADLAWHNEKVILAGQRALAAPIDAAALQFALDSGRDERDAELDRAEGLRRDAS